MRKPDRGIDCRMSVALGLVTLGHLLVVAAAFYVGWVLGVIALAVATGLLLASGRITGVIAGARLVSAEDEPALHGLVERLSQLDDVPKPRIALIDSDAPNAFAAGAGRHGTIFLTTGLIRRLPDRELQAVVSHELAHIVNRDSVLMASAWYLPLVGGVIAVLGVACSRIVRGGWLGLLFAFAGFLVAAFGAAVIVVGTLIALGLSRTREFAADRYAAQLTGDPRSLTSALTRLQAEATDARLIPLAALLFHPPRLGALSGLSTHPSIEARIRRLQRLESVATRDDPRPSHYLGRRAGVASAAIIVSGPLVGLGAAVGIVLALAASSQAGAMDAPAFRAPATAVHQAAPPSSDQRTATRLDGTVSAVVDGDTIKVVSRGFETPVRLIGIDTPETRDPRKVVQCFGPAASARTKRLLPIGQRVRLVTDPTQDTRDRYARLLAYVYKPGHSGARGSINFALVATGYAKVYVYGGVRFRFAVPFFRAQHRARKARNGLWGPPCRGNTTKPDPSAAEPATPPPATPPPPAPSPTTPRQGCDPNYAGACIPPYPPDLDCNQIPDRNFRVVGTDVHHFDVDRDGIACEE